jgi:hypothetical protein
MRVFLADNGITFVRWNKSMSPMHSNPRVLEQGLLVGVLLLLSQSVMAAGFVDSLADIVSWIAIIIIPIILGIVYWQIHYLPSKIAEKRQHPQQEAIHAMCMVSRFSGGLFWPIAFVWAHLRPAIVPLSKDQVSAIAQSNKKSEEHKDESC